jgi:predicted DNA-binding transcriptional regulator AlpA
MAVLVVLIQHRGVKGASMEIMSPRQVSEYTSVPLGTLRYWRHCGFGPASFTLGRRVVYRRAEVERWIAAQEAGPNRRGGGDAA